MNTLNIDEKSVVSIVIDEIGSCLRRISPASLIDAVSMISDAERIFLAGAGRSGLGIRGFAMRLMHLGKNIYVVGETTTPAISTTDLLVIGSGSGRTGSLLTMARKAKEIGAKILLLTIDPNSPIGQLADHIVEIPASSPKIVGSTTTGHSIQPMGSLFEQSLFVLLDCLILLLMKKKNQTAEQMFGRHANLE